MIEVEAKVRIDNPSRIRQKASDIAKFIGVEHKIDDYYTLENLKNYPLKSIRIRKKKGHYVVNIKKSISHVGKVHAKREFEFEIKDVATFVNLLKDFGFRKWLTKEKTTYNYEINKNFHIEINNVKGLGWFLEVEYLAEKNQVSMARNKVQGIIRKMGFEEKGIVVEGYTKLLWNLKH